MQKGEGRGGQELSDIYKFSKKLMKVMKAMMVKWVKMMMMSSRRRTVNSQTDTGMH